MNRKSREHPRESSEEHCNLEKSLSFSSDEVSRILSRTIVQSVEEPFNIIDRQYRILWMSRKSRLKNYIGTVCYESYRDRKSPCDQCPVEQVFRTGQSFVMEKHVRCSGGLEMWAEVRSYPVLGENGEVLYVLKIGYDITSRRLELALQKKKVARLETALRALAKDETALPENLNSNGACVKFSRREFDVLRLMARGLTNSDIAQILQLSPHTIKSHIISIFNKLGVGDRTQAAVWAARLHII